MTKNKQNLGRFVRVNLRDVWASEAEDFTPWLAREENLEILSESLGIVLELEALEKAVGPFRAEILCKEGGTDTRVLIENRLERSDHVHLGQLLTSASGLEAVTIVWIAARFTDEHRSTLDWLNRITDDHFRFFGLEIELWRIGASLAAPKFNVISKPNDWSRSIAQAARSIEDSGVSETKALQQAYWSAFNTALDKAEGPVLGNRKPQSKSWMAFPIGRSQFNLGTTITRSKREISAYLYIKGVHAKTFFHLLTEQKDAIERELGYPLQWEELPSRQDSRISLFLRDVDPTDEDGPGTSARMVGSEGERSASGFRTSNSQP